MTPYTCPFCGHTADVDGAVQDQILTCNECQTTIAYGLPMPRVAVQAHPDDPRFVAILVESRSATLPGRFQLNVERTYGLAIAAKLLSVCKQMPQAPGLAPDAKAATVPA